MNESSDHAPDILWGGRDRACSRCGTVFRSRFDVGRCTRCGRIFSAFRELGPPLGTNVAEAEALAVARRSAKTREFERTRLSNIRSELTPVAGFPISEVEPGSQPSSRGGRWEAERRELLAALEAGGRLYRWTKTWNCEESAGFLVVKDDKVVATITVEEFPSDLPRELREST